MLNIAFMNFLELHGMCQLEIIYVSTKNITPHDSYEPWFHSFISASVQAMIADKYWRNCKHFLSKEKHVTTIFHLSQVHGSALSGCSSDFNFSFHFFG